MADPRVAYTLFCDDIRPEIGGKLSFMGGYNGNLPVIPPFPAIFGKFCFLIVLICDVDDRPEYIRAYIKSPNGQETTGEPLRPQPLTNTATDSKKVFYNQILQCAPFVIPCEGVLEVWIETEKGKITAGHINVKESVSTEPKSGLAH